MIDPQSASKDRWIFGALVVLMVWLPLPLGSNRLWAWSIMEIWIFGLSLLWMIQYLRGQVHITSAFVHATPVVACLTLTALWMVLQVIALPPAAIEILSPHAQEIHTITQSPATLSLNPYATVQSVLKTLSFLLLFSLVTLTVRDRCRIRYLAYAILISGTFQASYGAIMTLSGLEYGFFVQKDANLGVATGTFINRNHLAGYLEMCLAVGIGLMIADLSRSSERGWQTNLRRLLRTLLGRKARIRLALVVMATGLILTRSRMGNVAFFSSLAVVGFFYLFVARRLTKPAIIFFASLLIIDLILIGNFFGIEEVAERLQQTSSEQERRDEVYRDTLDIIQDYPIFGSGAGSFYSVYPMYEQGDTSLFFNRHTQNDYLQFAAELGLPVFVLLAFSVIASLYSSARSLIDRRDRLIRGLSFASAMGITSLLLHSFVDYNLQIPSNGALFIVLMALAWVSRFGSASRKHA